MCVIQLKKIKSWRLSRAELEIAGSATWHTDEEETQNRMQVGKQSF